MSVVIFRISLKILIYDNESISFDPRVSADKIHYRYGAGTLMGTRGKLNGYFKYPSINRDGTGSETLVPAGTRIR